MFPKIRGSMFLPAISIVTRLLQNFQSFLLQLTLVSAISVLKLSTDLLTTMTTPTLINLPPPPSDPVTPTEMGP
jgi:hypothetical protein